MDYSEKLLIPVLLSILSKPNKELSENYHAYGKSILLKKTSSSHLAKANSLKGFKVSTLTGDINKPTVLKK